MSAFLTDLIVKEIDDGTWEIRATLIYRSDLLAKDIEVPVGFVTDFASVPRIPLIFDALGDIAHEPAVVHDWLYKVGIYDRRKADQVLLEGMEVTGVSWWRRWQIYAGVRIGGWKAWYYHRRKDDPK